MCYAVSEFRHQLFRVHIHTGTLGWSFSKSQINTNENKAFGFAPVHKSSFKIKLKLMLG